MQQELLGRILKLESDDQELQGQVKSVLEEKCNNSESLQGEITKCDHQADTLGNQINQLCTVERGKNFGRPEIRGLCLLDLLNL